MISRPRMLQAGAVVLMITAVTCAGYYYYRYQEALKHKDEMSYVREKVSSLMQLPTDEVPTLAHVSDKTQLSNDSFFDMAENGDKVLIYMGARKAILYRPSTNKIINIGPVHINDTSATPSANGTSEETTAQDLRTVPFSIDIYNGTRTAGLAREAQKLLTSTFSSARVLRTTDAQNDHDTSLLFVQNSELSGQAKAVAELFGAQIQSTAKNPEASSSADLVLILGGDR